MAYIVFEYKMIPAYGYLSRVAGYSIRVYKNGSIIRCSFDGVHDSPVEEQEISYAPELAERIESITRIHMHDLRKIPSELRNGSVDGAFHTFRFGMKKIRALNISRHNVVEIQKFCPELYEQYKDTIAYENKVLDVYEKVLAAIREFGITEQMLPEIILLDGGTKSEII